MKLSNSKYLLSMAVIGAGLTLAGCGQSDKTAADESKPAASTEVAAAAPAAGEEEKILNIYNWSDYLAPDTIPNFEKETGIKVRYDIFDSNEILHAKMIAKNTGYDIVVPSSNWGKMQMDGGLLQ